MHICDIYIYYGGMYVTTISSAGIPYVMEVELGHSHLLGQQHGRVMYLPLDTV